MLDGNCVVELKGDVTIERTRVVVNAVHPRSKSNDLTNTILIDSGWLRR